jgi:uncharacterized membrane protein
VYAATTGLIFLVIAIVHLLRIIFNWQAVMEGRALPMWASWIALFVAGYFAYQGFRLGANHE